MCNIDRPGVMERAVSAVSQDIQRYIHKFLTLLLTRSTGIETFHFNSLFLYDNYCFGSDSLAPICNLQFPQSSSQWEARADN
jgi:hypothetical protein